MKRYSIPIMLLVLTLIGSGFPPSSVAADRGCRQSSKCLDIANTLADQKRVRSEKRTEPDGSSASSSETSPSYTRDNILNFLIKCLATTCPSAK